MSDNRPLVTVTDDRVEYRASGLGMCRRALVAARKGFSATPPPKRLQKVFDEGTALEKHILSKLVTDHGWTLVPGSEQTEVRLHVGTTGGKHLWVVGHFDKAGSPPGGNHPIPIDAKAFGPDFYSEWERKGIDGFPHYGWQQSCYAEGYGTDTVCLAIYNKDTDVVLPVILSQPFTYEQIQGRIYSIEIESDLDPTAIECENKWGCPFSYLHDEPAGTPIPDGVSGLVEQYHSIGRKIETWSGIRKTVAELILDDLPYDEDTRTFTSNGLSVSVVSNSRRLDMEKVKQLFREAEIDIDGYYKPGQGYHITVKEKGK